MPYPVDHDRHAIVIAKFDDVELVEAKLEPEQVTDVLDLTLSKMTDAHTAGYVYVDVSEYNVAVDKRGAIMFDWPQAVPTDHDSVRELLARDAKNIVGYFRRKYPGEIPDEVDIDVLSDVTAGNEFGNVDEFAV